MKHVIPGFFLQLFELYFQMKQPCRKIRKGQTHETRR